MRAGTLEEAESLPWLGAIVQAAYAAAEDSFPPPEGHFRFHLPKREGRLRQDA